MEALDYSDIEKLILEDIVRLYHALTIPVFWGRYKWGVRPTSPIPYEFERYGGEVIAKYIRRISGHLQALTKDEIRVFGYVYPQFRDWFLTHEGKLRPTGEILGAIPLKLVIGSPALFLYIAQRRQANYNIELIQTYSFLENKKYRDEVIEDFERIKNAIHTHEKKLGLVRYEHNPKDVIDIANHIAENIGEAINHYLLKEVSLAYEHYNQARGLWKSLSFPQKEVLQQRDSVTSTFIRTPFEKWEINHKVAQTYLLWIDRRYGLVTPYKIYQTYFLYAPELKEFPAYGVPEKVRKEMIKERVSDEITDTIIAEDREIAELVEKRYITTATIRKAIADLLVKKPIAFREFVLDTRNLPLIKDSLGQYVRIKLKLTKFPSGIAERREKNAIISRIDRLRFEQLLRPTMRYETNPSPNLSKAKEIYERFHAYPYKGVKQITIPEPKVLVNLGKASCIGYESPKGRRAMTKYIHHWRKGKSRKGIVTYDPESKTVISVVPAKITERGIEDLG